MTYRTIFNLNKLGILSFEWEQKTHYQIDYRSFYIQLTYRAFLHIINVFLSDVRFEWRISIESNLDEPPCAGDSLPAKYCRLKL